MVLGVCIFIHIHVNYASVQLYIHGSDPCNRVTMSVEIPVFHTYMYCIICVVAFR